MSDGSTTSQDPLEVGLQWVSVDGRNGVSVCLSVPGQLLTSPPEDSACPGRQEGEFIHSSPWKGALAVRGVWVISMLAASKERGKQELEYEGSSGVDGMWSERIHGTREPQGRAPCQGKPGGRGGMVGRPR